MGRERPISVQRRVRISWSDVIRRQEVNKNSNGKWLHWWMHVYLHMYNLHVHVQECTRTSGQKRMLGKRKINADAKVKMHSGQQLWLSYSNENECKCKSGNVIATVDSNGKRLHWSTCGRTSICICATEQNLRLGLKVKEMFQQPRRKQEL